MPFFWFLPERLRRSVDLSICALEHWPLSGDGGQCHGPVLGFEARPWVVSRIHLQLLRLGGSCVPLSACPGYLPIWPLSLGGIWHVDAQRGHAVGMPSGCSSLAAILNPAT